MLKEEQENLPRPRKEAHMPHSLRSLRAEPYKLPKGSIEITLSCGHTAWYVRPAPRQGEDAYCRACGEWRDRIDGDD